ncbi:MAG: hypothetical protein OEV99_04445 [Nitrospira sp.]|nr:hypothetical protein [Nitrospira sp.]MDH4369073.1 hypothetical protein [Nitrospira sp.]MDH5348580.1 hypothetical protein [Nitrospira sp.]MDH5496721.1 hypothetical protein [Nitrospira sp.]MDH5725915.1 hypothetical protein [Nitrospira sp.]
MKWMKIGTMLAAMFPALAAAGSVEVTAFANKPFCETVAGLTGDQFDFKSGLSRTVGWEPVELNGEGPTARRCSSLDKTIIDLDNDGRADLLVKTTFCMKGDPSDSLYVFPADSQVLEETSWQDLSPLLATHDKFERTGGTYALTSLRGNKGGTPPALTTTFSLQPFLLDGRVYIGLTDARREWLVITKYRGGERFEDLCYLHTR